MAVEGGPLASEHPEWLVTHDDGRPVTALTHPVWGGKIFALDTTRDDVCAHLTASYAALLAQGFEYHKIDFCFAAGIPGRRFGDGAMTRAEALRRGLEAVRAGIGDDAYLLGCGSPLLSAVGIVDAMRVSEDVAPFWESTQFAPGWQECSVAARNAIEQSVLRAPMHRRWFLNDPDCLLLRPTSTDLTSDERLALATSILGTGAYLIVSDDLSTYTTREWELLDRLIELQPQADTTLDRGDPFRGHRYGRTPASEGVVGSANGFARDHLGPPGRALRSFPFGEGWGLAEVGARGATLPTCANGGIWRYCSSEF